MHFKNWDQIINVGMIGHANSEDRDFRGIPQKKFEI